MQLWLEYRGTFSRVSADEPGAYACSCCKRWSRVVFVTGETGGKGDGAELTARATVARALQQSVLARPAEAAEKWSRSARVRIPTDQFHTEGQSGRANRS